MSKGYTTMWNNYRVLWKVLFLAMLQKSLLCCLRLFRNCWFLFWEFLEIFKYWSLLRKCRWFGFSGAFRDAKCQKWWFSQILFVFGRKSWFRYRQWIKLFLWKLRGKKKGNSGWWWGLPFRSELSGRKRLAVYLMDSHRWRSYVWS